MRRRVFLSGLSAGATPFVTGCLTGESKELGDDDSDADSTTDAPTFEANENEPPTGILLAAQPQAPNGIFLHDRFDIGIAIGNAGGGTLTGECTVRLTPTDTDGSTQTDSITIDENETIPSGAARFFRVGPFRATATGTWELVGGPEITEIHPEYDGTVHIAGEKETGDTA